VKKVETKPQADYPMSSVTTARRNRRRDLLSHADTLLRRVESRSTKG